MSRRSELACVVSVYNEEAVLERAVRMLVPELKKYARQPLLVIASNGSTDGTNEIGARLERELAPDVRLLVCKQKGRGWALREAMGDIEAERYFYVDVDLPLELDDIGLLLGRLDEGADLVVSRRQGDRPVKRRLMTWSLRRLNRLAFGLRVSDSQCSVKALSPAAAWVLVNDCKENGWYLDTELVVLAHRRGLTIAEVPIHWIEQRFDRRHSKVSVASDTLRFMLALREIWVRRARLPKG
jgi:glycosyltransferase involved in cell wall biosynthesis